jgi:hypothetical protein
MDGNVEPDELAPADLWRLPFAAEHPEFKSGRRLGTGSRPLVFRAAVFEQSLDGCGCETVAGPQRMYLQNGRRFFSTERRGETKYPLMHYAPGFFSARL